MFLFTTNDFIFSKIHLFLDLYGKVRKKVSVESLRIVHFWRAYVEITGLMGCIWLR